VTHGNPYPVTSGAVAEWVSVLTQKDAALEAAIGIPTLWINALSTHYNGNFIFYINGLAYLAPAKRHSPKKVPYCTFEEWVAEPGVQGGYYTFDRVTHADGSVSIMATALDGSGPWTVCDAKGILVSPNDLIKPGNCYFL
jgi:hypothetical protein